jgi:hypothetical protein
MRPLYPSKREFCSRFGGDIKGEALGLVRYTPRNENFVLVLEGISRAKPLAS